MHYENDELFISSPTDISETDFQLIVNVSRFDVADNRESALTPFGWFNDSEGNQLI